jgi:hypothetical protein
VTIPTLALTAFALVFAALLFSLFEPGADDNGSVGPATVIGDA